MRIIILTLLNKLIRDLNIEAQYVPNVIILSSRKKAYQRDNWKGKQKECQASVWCQSGRNAFVAFR